MTRGRLRPERRPGRQNREPVPAASPDQDGGWFPEEYPDGPFGGSAGVREPRHPKPHGPMSGAGEKPMPEAEFEAVLPDPRWPAGDHCGDQDLVST